VESVDYYSWRASCARASPVADADPRALMTVDELALAGIAGIEIDGSSQRVASDPVERVA
jgi:hypothetical protein